jgi:TPR repeat protein
MDQIALFDQFIANDHSYATYFQIEKTLRTHWRSIILLDYVKSLDLTNSNVQVLLGTLYYWKYNISNNNDINDNNANKGEAIKWYQLSAKQCNSYGQHELSRIYIFGIGIKKDLSKGIALCNLSAKQNNPYALRLLADLFRKDGTDTNEVLNSSFDNDYNYFKYSLFAIKAENNHAINNIKTILKYKKYDTTIIKLFDQIDELVDLETEQKAKIEEQENHILHLEFMPDGPKYTETKENFDLTVIDGKKLMI